MRSIEESRVAAEREARMRVESTEATERQRHQAAIEQQRLQQEMELRRAEVAKKRPTWMLAVTGLAVVGAVVLAYVGVTAYHSSQEDKAKAEQARRDKDEYAKQVQKLKDDVEKSQRDLDDISGKVDKAVSDVANAKNAPDIAAAQARLASSTRRRPR